MSLSVGFAKLGKSIKFRRKKWNANGGDNEPTALLQALANNYPRNTYYLVGRSDWRLLTELERTELFPNGNVVDCWEGCELDAYFDATYDTWLLERIGSKYPELDHTVMLVGQLCTANLRGITRKKGDASNTVMPLAMALNYSTPVMRWLNERTPPYVEVITDQLYDLSQVRDLVHFPTHSLGQLDCVYESFHIRSYEDQTEVVTKVPSTYAPVETLFCVGRSGPVPLENRDSPFVVVCNERRPSRYPMLKSWVLDQFPDVPIYGKWDPEIKRIATDPRFQGTLHLDQLHSLMRRVKTTFVVPQHRGGVTSKWVEMLHSGVVPFFHPDYDVQKHVAVPKLLRPQTPAELRASVELVLSSDEGRVSLLESLRSKLLHGGFYDGSVVAEKIMGLVHGDLGLPPPERGPAWKITPKTVSSLDDFFC